MIARAFETLGALIGGERQAITAARENEVLSPWLEGSTDAEVLAAHYDCFGRNAFPHAGVYLDPAGLITGDVDLAGALRRLAAHESGGALDAVRAELAALLTWIPPFAIAARACDARPWPAIVDLAVELIAARAADLTVDPLVTPSPPRPSPPWGEDVGLRDIAEGLCLPRRAGFLLTVDGLRGLARRLGVPAGFGSRRQLLRRFLESAAAFERAAGALAGLEQLAAAAVVDLVELSQHPGLTRACQPWIEQSDATRATLAGMRAELSTAARAVDG